MKYSSRKKVSHPVLVCSHPMVSAFWETGSMSADNGVSMIKRHFHLLTYDEKRHEVEVIHTGDESEAAAFAQLDEWLDNQYPHIKKSLSENRQGNI